MNNYSDAVEKIVESYMDRLKFRLNPVPARERDEFLQEIRSHIYESYLQAAGNVESAGSDDVTRILGVLGKLGEPAEVLADRFSEAMMSSGTRRKFPLHIVAGVLIALFGIPLGFGGVAVLAGVLVALAGIVLSFYATMAVVLLAGTLLLVLGLTRIYEPAVWDKLLAYGVIQMDGPVAGLFDQLTPLGQGVFMIVLAGVFVVCGMAMLWLGKYLTRGLRFLFALVFDWIRKLAMRVRRRFFPNEGEVFQIDKVLDYRSRAGSAGVI
jgi:uncharacterized membrane protein